MTESILVGATLILFGELMRRVVRDAYHPAVAFAWTWGCALVLIGLAVPRGFFPLGPLALAMFAGGACWFGLVSAAVSRTLGPSCVRESAGLAIDARRLAWLCLAAHVVMVPAWWFAILNIAEGATEITAIAFQLRVKAVEDNLSSGPLVDNYLILGLILTPVLFLAVLKRDLPAWLFAATCLPWIAMNLVSNGRASLVQLVLALAFVHHMSGARWSGKALLRGLLAFVVIVAGGDYLVGKSDVAPNADFGEIVWAFADTFASYLLQGPALFSRYIDAGATAALNWDALSFFCSVLSKVDLCTPPPTIHTDFNQFGYGDWIGNVYSMYFSLYPRYGWVGTAALLTVYSAWITWHTHHARNGPLFHVVVAAYLFSAIPLSVFSDLFGPSLNFLIKSVVVCVFIQRFFPGVDPGRRVDGRPDGSQRTLSTPAAHPGA